MKEIQQWTFLPQPISYFSPNSSYTCTTSTTATFSDENCSSFGSNVSPDSSFTSSQQAAATAAAAEPKSSSLFHVCIATFRTPTQQISCLAVHGDLLYAASINGINVFDLNTHSLIDTFSSGSLSSGLVKSIAFDNRKIYTAHQDCRIRVWKLTENNNHRLVSTLPTVKERLKRCVLPRNYVPVRRHQKKLWIEHVDTVSGLAVNSDFLYSVSWDKCFKIWSMSDSCCLESLPAHSDAINAIVVSDDGTVYTASADGHIKVWQKSLNQNKHALLASLDKHSTNVNALALNSNGSALFSGGSDQTILVWEREDGGEKNHMNLRWSLTGHTNAVLCLAYIDDLLISGSSDRTIRVWKRGIDFGYLCLGVLEGHSRPVKSIVAVSSGGEGDDGSVSVFSGSIDGEIRVWHLASKQHN